MKYRPSAVAQSPRPFQNPWRTLTLLEAEEDVRYLRDASAGSGGTGTGGPATPEVGVCDRDGALEEDLDGVELRGVERALVGESALDGEVARVEL